MGWVDDFVAYAESQVDDRMREALYTRGVTDEQMALYRLGYFNRELPDLPYPKEFLDWSKDGGKLDDVIVLPLTTTLGALKGLQFRHVERERAGYMDFIAEKGDLALFGLAQAMPHVWETRSIALVEGGFDLFPIQRTFPGSVATLTARVVEPLVRILRRLVAQVWLIYDMDTPGRNACEKFTRQHGEEFKIHVPKYPSVPKIGGGLTKDPGELWEAWGEEKFSAHFRSVMDPQREPFHA